MSYYSNILLKLSLSVVLGAMIGLERENKNRPAGLRTNILVCLGSALVQIISLDIFSQYGGIIDMDPARLGAQVISGIGFLGAGTIIREGASVKGLTTAAGLWVVACIGLAIGNGSYMPAVLTAIFAYLTLKMLKSLEEKVTKKSLYFEIVVQIEDKPGQIGKIGQLLGSMDVNIKNIEFGENVGNMLKVYFSLKLPAKMEKQEVIDRLLREAEIISIEEL